MLSSVLRRGFTVRPIISSTQAFSTGSTLDQVQFWALVIHHFLSYLLLQARLAREGGRKLAALAPEGREVPSAAPSNASIRV